VESLGGQFEAGWRFTFDRLDIEPLASVSAVKSSFEDIRVPADDPVRFGGNVQFDDPESLRAGLGVRLAMRNILPGVAPIDARLTTRVLNESEGKSRASIENVGPFDAPVSDTFDGTFTEVSGGVSVRNTRGTVSGFLDVDAAFGDDYDSLGFTTGVRVQW
jgi:outer membrane autotransporter protein